MFPYHDENATQRTPVVTMTLIALNVAAFIGIQGAGADQPMAASLCNLGLIPGELMASVPPGTTFPMDELEEGLVCVTDPGRQPFNIFTSMFMHGGWMHLLGNMWFLWLFGNNIEDSTTRPRFLVFYLICGVAAALAQVAADPASIIPMVGASGAISGVMGAYLVLFPRVKVFTIVPLGFYATTVALPAWVMLIYWMVLQVVFQAASTVSGQEGGVAYLAHIGGFVAGVVLIKVFERRDRVREHVAHHWAPRRAGWN
jgi:membrane associated rhomboid family serine protease